MKEAYDLKKEIGRGRFGTVYLCNCRMTGMKFAAKFVNTKRNQDRENVEREIEIMKTLNIERPHPKLIQLYDAFDMGKEMCLVLEVVQGGELFERVTDDDFVLTERACAIFIQQIIEGIEFIHSKNVLHLDMKPENILCMSREGNRVKICDFGLARKYDPRKKLQVLFGTPEFVAPEVVNFEPISFGTDMWSIGVICYVLLSGLSPFMGHNYVETMTNVTHNKYDFDDDVFDEVSDEVKDFIEHLLILDKSERLTPAQCLVHKWFKTALTLKPTSKDISQEDISTTEREAENGRESESSLSSCESSSKSVEEVVVGGKLDLRLNGDNERETTVNEVTINVTAETKQNSLEGANNYIELVSTRGSLTATAAEPSPKNVAMTSSLTADYPVKMEISAAKEIVTNVVHSDEYKVSTLSLVDPDDLKKEISHDSGVITESDSQVSPTEEAESTAVYESTILTSQKESLLNNVRAGNNLYLDEHFIAKKLDRNNSPEKLNSCLSFSDGAEKSKEYNAINIASQDRTHHLQSSQENFDEVKALYESIFSSDSKDVNTSSQISGKDIPVLKENIHDDKNRIEICLDTSESAPKQQKDIADSTSRQRDSFVNKTKPVTNFAAVVRPSENVNITKLVENIKNKRVKQSSWKTPSSSTDTNISSDVELLSAKLYSEESIADTKSLYDSIFNTSKMDSICEGSKVNNVAATETGSRVNLISQGTCSPAIEATMVNSQSTVYCDSESLKAKAEIQSEDIVRKSSAVENSLKRTISGSLRNKEKSFDGELQLTKKYLQEFVERWRSHPNSPYIIASPKVTLPLTQLQTESLSRASFASVDVAPPSAVDLSDLDDDDDVETSAVSSFTSSQILRSSPLPPEKIARELELRLTVLKNEESLTRCTCQDLALSSNKHVKRAELINVQNNSSRVIQTKKSGAEGRKKEKEVLKRSDNVKLRPTRDVMVLSEKDKKSYAETPECVISPTSTPDRRSRKSSREARSPSRESDRVRRRPSRDVPLSSSQLDQLRSGMIRDRCSTVELWPDMICLTKDDSDSKDVDYQPITAKLELPVIVPDKQKSSSTSDSKQAHMKKAKSCDDANSSKQDKKIVTWVLDLDTPSQLSFGSSWKTEIYKIEKDIKERSASSLKTSERIELQLPVELSKTSSASSFNSESSADSMTIQTPWGPMKSTPLKTSPKGSDNTTIINIKDCFINITKTVNADRQKSPAPEVHSSKGKSYVEAGKHQLSEGTSSWREKRKRFSDRSHKISEPADKNKVEKDLIPASKSTHSDPEERAYSLTSSKSIGKYSICLPNNIKPSVTLSQVERSTNGSTYNKLITKACSDQTVPAEYNRSTNFSPQESKILHRSNDLPNLPDKEMRLEQTHSVTIETSLETTKKEPSEMSDQITHIRETRNENEIGAADNLKRSKEVLQQGVEDNIKKSVNSSPQTVSAGATTAVQPIERHQSRERKRKYECVKTPQNCKSDVQTYRKHPEEVIAYELPQAQEVNNRLRVLSTAQKHSSADSPDRERLINQESLEMENTLSVKDKSIYESNKTNIRVRAADEFSERRTVHTVQEDEIHCTGTKSKIQAISREETKKSLSRSKESKVEVCKRSTETNEPPSENCDKKETERGRETHIKSSKTSSDILPHSAFREPEYKSKMASNKESNVFADQETKVENTASSSDRSIDSTNGPPGSFIGTEKMSASLYKYNSSNVPPRSRSRDLKKDPSVSTETTVLKSRDEDICKTLETYSRESDSLVKYQSRSREASSVGDEHRVRSQEKASSDIRCREAKGFQRETNNATVSDIKPNVRLSDTHQESSVRSTKTNNDKNSESTERNDEPLIRYSDSNDGPVNRPRDRNDGPVIRSRDRNVASVNRFKDRNDERVNISRDRYDEPVIRSRDRNDALVNRSGDRNDEPVIRSRDKNDEPIIRTRDINDEQVVRSRDRNDEPVNRARDSNDEPVVRSRDRNDEPVNRSRDRTGEPVIRSRDRNNEPSNRSRDRTGEPVIRSRDRNDKPVNSYKDINDKPVIRSRDRTGEPVIRSRDRNDKPVSRSRDRNDEIVSSSKGINDKPVITSRDENERNSIEVNSPEETDVKSQKESREVDELKTLLFDRSHEALTQKTDDSRIRRKKTDEAKPVYRDSRETAEQRREHGTTQHSKKCESADVQESLTSKERFQSINSSSISKETKEGETDSVTESMNLSTARNEGTDLPSLVSHLQSTSLINEAIAPQTFSTHQVNQPSNCIRNIKIDLQDKTSQLRFSNYEQIKSENCNMGSEVGHDFLTKPKAKISECFVSTGDQRHPQNKEENSQEAITVAQKASLVSTDMKSSPRRPYSFHESLIPITRKKDAATEFRAREILIPITNSTAAAVGECHSVFAAQELVRKNFTEIPIRKDEKKLHFSRFSPGYSESGDSGLKISKSTSPVPSNRTLNNLQDVSERLGTRNILHQTVSSKPLEKENNRGIVSSRSSSSKNLNIIPDLIYKTSELPPKPPDEKTTSSSNYETRGYSSNDSQRNSMSDLSDDGNPHYLRKSRTGLPPVRKRPMGLFSTQDRISQFEQKIDIREGRNDLKPIARTRSSTVFSEPASPSKPEHPSRFNSSNLFERSKLSPVVVCTRV